MAQADNVPRMCPPVVHQGGHTLPPQPGLIRHLEQHAVAGRQGLQTQADGAADALLRVGVLHGQEPESFRQFQDGGVLGDNRYGGQHLPGDGLQSQTDQRPPV